MFLILWEFRTSTKARAQFIRAYGPDGAWARLFRRAPGYRGTLLFRDPRRRLRFFTLDLWRSKSAFTRAKRLLRSEYQALDRRCASLTTSETRLGAFSLETQNSEGRTPPNLQARKSHTM